MERKPLIQYSGKTIFTDGEIKMLQEFSSVTEYFEQKIIENDNNNSLAPGRIFPARINVDFDRRNVTLFMNNYAVGETTDYGDSIKVRRTDNGFLIGNSETSTENFRQIIDSQLEKIIR